MEMNTAGSGLRTSLGRPSASSIWNPVSRSNFRRKELPTGWWTGRPEERVNRPGQQGAWKAGLSAGAAP